jgi:hypothetical protein
MKGTDALTSPLFFETERAKILNNMAKRGREINGIYDFIGTSLQRDYEDELDFLHKVFPWESSYEGGDYWVDVFTRLANGGTDTMSPKKHITPHMMAINPDWIT